MKWEKRSWWHCLYNRFYFWLTGRNSSEEVRLRWLEWLEVEKILKSLKKTKIRTGELLIVSQAIGTSDTLHHFRGSS